jgi:hypothetical protein
MSAKHWRLVTFAGNTIAIEYSGLRSAAIVDFLYRHIPAESDIPPHTTYRIIPSDPPKRMALYRGDALIYEGDSAGTLAELLLGDSCRHLAEQSRNGLLFHAAGLAWQGKGLFMPGGIGAGKSTLAAWLTMEGLDYLTDELVFVPCGADTMQTFTRPLNVKKTSRTALQYRFDFERHAAHISSTPHADLILPTLLKPTNTLSEPPLSLIVFPRYLPGSDFVLRALSGAQAGLALMRCLVNARNLPDYGFSEIARLARTAPAYQMSYSNFAQVGEQVEALLQSSPSNLRHRPPGL